MTTLCKLSTPYDPVDEEKEEEEEGRWRVGGPHFIERKQTNRNSIKKQIGTSIE
jgi:hypothetical protein